MKFHPYTPTSLHPQVGFTLIELLVSVAVFAVLLTLGVPSFQNVIASSRLSGQTNDMVGALTQARAEAIRRGTRITLCRSSNGTSCAISGGWEQGWIMFVDTTRSGTTAAVDSGETVLMVHQESGGPVVMTGNTDVAAYISFGADGRAKLMNGASQTGTVRVCNPSGALSNDNRARDIEISAVGRIISRTPSGVDATCPAP